MPSAQKGICRKEGEYWTVGVGGKVFQLKDSKGLAYLSHLLRYPAEEFHVLDLAAGIADRSGEDGLPRSGDGLEKTGLHIGSLGDAGELLDDQAKSAYRRRLSELHEDLEEARELAKIERAQQVEDEIEALNKELARAVGLGGRNRRAASASERARQSVTKTLKAVVERIAQSDAALGAALSRSIKTGNFCSYRPDSNFPIAWEFAATVTEPQQPSPPGNPAAAQTSLAQSTPLVFAVSLFPLAERTTFVGRETEKTSIRTMIDHALNGYGSLFMIGAGAGVGKSRLAMEMSGYASQLDFRCFVGHCYERNERVPYLPFVEIIENSLAQAPSLETFRRQIGDNATQLAQLAPNLRRIFPDIPPPMELPPAEMRRYLFQSLTEMLGRLAQNRPLLIVVEDLHWADESTLALLIHLTNRIAQLPIAIIGTYRDGFSEDTPALVRTLEELIRSGIRPLKLGGLSREDVAQMLHALSGRQVPENLVSLIFEESQGNPFFVEEVYRHLMEEGKVFDAAGHFQTDLRIDEIDVPENVRLITNRRLERLGSDQKKVLEAAAVIGRSFSFQLLSDVSQTHVDELFGGIEKAQQMGIVVPSSQGPETPFTFVHELVRQTLLAGISPPRRQHLHSVVAQAIERLYSGALNRSAGEIADHLLKAGSFADRRKLVHWLTQAGQAALEAAAFEEARSSFLSAMSHEEVISPSEKADLLNGLATAHRCLGQWDTEVANRREAVEICIDLDDRERMGKSFIELAEALSFTGRLGEASEAAYRGLAYLGPHVSANRAHLLCVLAGTLKFTQGYEAASEALREALDIARHLSDPKLQARLFSDRCRLNSLFLHVREAIADGLQSEQSGGLEALPQERNALLNNLLMARLYLGHMEDALRIVDEIESRIKKAGPFNTDPISRCAKVWIEFGRNADLASYETELERALESEQTVEHWNVLSETYLALVNFLRGNWSGALAHLRSLGRSKQSERINGFSLVTLFFVLSYIGDRDGALTILEENRMLLPRLDRHNWSGSWWVLALVVEGLTMLGERSQAGELYPLARELIGTGAVLMWPLCRFTQTTAGIAAAAARQWEASEEHFRVALAQAESVPYRLEEAEIRRFHAMMLLDRAAPGDRERARTLVGEALDLYTRIGMRRHTELIKHLLEKTSG